MPKEIVPEEKNSRPCVVCTGCGRCGFGAKRDGFQVVTDWQEIKRSAAEGESVDETAGPCVDEIVGGNADESVDESAGTSADESVDENAGTCVDETAGASEREDLMIVTDIGTTTIAMQLRRICDGKVVDTFRAVNPQRKYGADVLSRIQAANTGQEANAEQKPNAGQDIQGSAGSVRDKKPGTQSTVSPAEEMRALVLGILQEGISRFQKKASYMVIAANTTMIHLLMGYPTESLGKAPFVSEHLAETQCTICGLQALILPGFSAFVGADIFAGVYACEMGESEEITLFLDLGTNGELVLGNKEGLVATATAAGPAFEGRLDAEVWGADAVRFLADLYREGLVDETGLLAEEYFETGISIGGTVMTQEDIRSIQLAKAAVYAGIDILTEEYGLSAIDEIDRVIIAGGLGYYLNPSDAAAIGMIPEGLVGKCVSVGNAALEGAFRYGRSFLTEKKQKDNIEFIRKTKVYNLADSHKFMQCYMAAINLPETRELCKTE